MQDNLISWQDLMKFEGLIDIISVDSKGWPYAKNMHNILTNSNKAGSFLQIKPIRKEIIFFKTKHILGYLKGKLNSERITIACDDYIHQGYTLHYIYKFLTTNQKVPVNNLVFFSNGFSTEILKKTPQATLLDKESCPTEIRDFHTYAVPLDKKHDALFEEYRKIRHNNDINFPQKHRWI